MFRDKFDFKKTFSDRVVEKYGRSLEQAHITEKYVVLGEMVRQYASLHWKDTKERVATLKGKQMFYFSMEVLIGRLLSNSLLNLGIHDVVKEGLEELDVDLEELVDLEVDPALGNGGLGRLAACFLDSLATLGLPGHGNTIRYEYGLFKQKIENGYQVEVPDQWLRLGNVWEVRKTKNAVQVPFWGDIEISTSLNGELEYKHVNTECVRAVPCDVPVVGQGTDVTNTLRLWTAEACDSIPKNKNFRTYLSEVSELTQNVYPDDSDEHGKYLRLKQQYFFVSAGLQTIVQNHKKQYGTLDNLPEKVVVQLNDTHPVLAIPELMRLLIDVYNYEWENAWSIVTKTICYTNHTVLSEALEKWPIHYLKNLLPRIYMIIEEINRRHIAQIYRKNADEALALSTSCIKDGLVHMANLGIIGSYSVNGVAELHTKILKTTVFKEFYKIWPNKFNNKTNGITHRRWLLYSNPQLTELLEEYIGDEFIHDISKLEKILEHADDKILQNKFMKVKDLRKKILIDFIKQETGIELDPNSIFDTLAKRLHAYKRQLLKCLHIIYLIKKIKSNPEFTMHKQSFIFAAKAAPSYAFAKEVIKLITTLSELVEKDPELNKFIKVVFIPNYRVTVAELLMNATDVSEQISTAGKEASGTGNMKFMMNGAITIGTLDGANVEIHNAVGDEHSVIFGLRVEDVNQLLYSGYSAREQLGKNPILAGVVNSLVDGSIHKNKNEFRLIYDELLYKNDEYFVLADFAAYCEAQEEIQRRYMDKSGWAKTCLVNIGKSSFFSSDRTISEYAEDIWKIQTIV